MIDKEIFKQLIREQQPILLPDNFVIRDIWHELQPLQFNTQIIILKGVRRCGKSTVLHYLRAQQQEAHFYFNFDDDRLVNFTIQDFQLLLETLIELLGPAKIVFFDEIQNVLGWEKFIRRLHDQRYKIYLTGSNAHLFSSELGTHLTGRYISLEVYPYAFSEYLTTQKQTFNAEKIYTTEEKSQLKRAFTNYYQTGGIPDYVRFQQPEYLSDLYDSILYRDIIVRHKIVKDQALKTLIFYLASNIGKNVSFNKLKNFLKLASATTVSEYCSFLEASYLCFLVNRYSHSLKVQAHYDKKEYFIDHALAKRIGFRPSEDYGRTLENIVFLELKRRRYEVYFYKGDKECDFVIKKANKIHGVIQVATSLHDPKTRDRELTGLKEAMADLELTSGLILTDDTQEELENITITPIWRWLLNKE